MQFAPLPKVKEYVFSARNLLGALQPNTGSEVQKSLCSPPPFPLTAAHSQLLSLHFINLQQGWMTTAYFKAADGGVGGVGGWNYNSTKAHVLENNFSVHYYTFHIGQFNLERVLLKEICLHLGHWVPNSTAERSLMAQLWTHNRRQWTVGMLIPFPP